MQRLLGQCFGFFQFAPHDVESFSSKDKLLQDAILWKRRIPCDLKRKSIDLAQLQHYCQARAGEFPRNDGKWYFNRISGSHAIFSISCRALKCEKRAKLQNTNSSLDFEDAKGTVLAGTFPEHFVVVVIFIF